MARSRRPARPGQGTPSPDVSAGLALAQSLENQRAQWEALSRAQKDAAYDMVLWTRQEQAASLAADRLTQSTRATTLAYAAASAGLLGWVRAGLSGTTTGEQLSFQQRQLSQQIASIFLPVVQKYIEGLTRLVEWFRHLSGEQQGQIMRWSLFTVGLLGSVTVVPRLTSALGTLAMALKGLTLANPFAALTAGVIGLLAQTAEGRDALADMGRTLGEVFGGLGELLSGPVGAGLAGISRFLATAGGQFIAFSTIAVAALYRIAAAGQGTATVFLGWGTAIGAAILLVGGLITALSRSKDEAARTAAEIEKGLRAGRTTPAEAREQLRQRAEEAAVEAEKVAREFAEKLIPEVDRPEYIAEQGRKARERVLREGEEAIARGGKGRQDVVQTAGGQEDPRATIRRLEAAVLKTDDPGKRTAAATEAIEDLMRKVAASVADAVKNLGGPPNPNAPAKED